MIRRTLLRIGEATNFGPEDIVDNRDSFTAVEGLVVFGLGLLLAGFLAAHRSRCLPLAGRVIAACYPSAMTPGQDLSLPTLPNLRDIGGYRTNSGGTVRTGFLYRSTALDRLAGDDIATFDSLGVQSVFDFRTEAERSAEPDRLPSGVRGIVLDVLKDSSDAAPAQLFSILAAPRRAPGLLGDGKRSNSSTGATASWSPCRARSMPTGSSSLPSPDHRHVLHCSIAPPARTAPAGRRPRPSCCSGCPRPMSKVTIC